jgi:hypothetical protein
LGSSSAMAGSTMGDPIIKGGGQEEEAAGWGTSRQRS